MKDDVSVKWIVEKMFIVFRLLHYFVVVTV